MEMPLAYRYLPGIDTRRLDPHQHLCGSWEGVCHLAHLEHLEATVFVEPHCLHSPLLRCERNPRFSLASGLGVVCQPQPVTAVAVEATEETARDDCAKRSPPCVPSG